MSNSPNQTLRTNEYSYPYGLRMDILADGEVAFEDVGVLADGVAWTFNSDNTDVENGNATDPPKQAKNMSVSIAPSGFRTWAADIQAKLSGGLITSTTVAGTLVSGEDQTVASGAWEYDTFIELTGQNSDGTQPTINSVEGSIDSTLVEGTDYNVVKAPGGWGIAVIDSATVTTEAQVLTINTDYTPSSGVILKSGTNSTILTYMQVRLRHYTESDFSKYDYEMLFHKVVADAGSMTMTKGGSLSGNTLDEWTLAMTAEVDDSKDDGEQLFTMYQGDPISA